MVPTISHRSSLCASSCENMERKYRAGPAESWSARFALPARKSVYILVAGFYSRGNGSYNPHATFLCEGELALAGDRPPNRWFSRSVYGFSDDLAARYAHDR